MRSGLGLVLTVVTALLIIVFTALPAHAQGVYVPPSCGWGHQINGSYIVIYNYGSEAYMIYLMTPDEYQVWSQGSGTYAIGGWVIQPQSSLAIQVPNSGDYMVMVPSTGSCQSGLTLYWVEGQGAPIGVSSFELASTNEVLSFFNITSMSAYNPNGESEFDMPNSGVSLQLNAILEVQLIDGTTQYYWVQDVIAFVTDKGKYNLADNVWNVTDTNGFLSNSTIAGNGYVTQATGGYYYAYSTSSQAYSLPLAGYLLIELTGVNPLEISFCYVIIQNGGQYYPPSFNCYDNVTIYTSEPVSSASIVSDPNAVTPSSNVIDTELVFGGYANGEYTTFNSLSAYLAILYWGNGAWEPYGDLFMNGWDTGEAATDLTSSVLPNGFIYVTTGSLPSGAGTFLTNTAPMPTLPMTYVSVTNPATGETWSGYITTPASFSFPTVVSVGSGTEYVFTGATVNGATQSSNVVTITPSSDFASYYVSANYEAYYLVSVSSPVPVTVNTYNESAITTEFREWVPSGSAISVQVPSIYLFNNGTRLVYTGGNETITVNQPLSLSINQFVKQYMVNMSSLVPIIVTTPTGVYNTTSLTTWIDSGSTISINVPKITNLGNGTRLVYTGNNETITVSEPLSLVISQFIRQYLVSVTSLVPVIVATPGGVFNATSLSIWVNEGSTVDIAVPRIYDLGNGTRLVYTGGNESITVSKPLSITVNQFIRQYLVSITSLVPVIITAPGGIYNTTSLTTWIDSGSTISINVPKITNLGNGTRLVYTGNNETITVNQPLTVGIPTSEFVRQYLVTVASQYPVTLNGTKITQFSAWLSPGTVLSIEPATVFSNGAFLSEPGYTITVSKPMDIAVQWQINWVLTGVMYGGLAAVIAGIAIVLITKSRRR